MPFSKRGRLTSREHNMAINDPALTSDDPFEKLIAVMRALRSPAGGCPWDVQQTFETIAPYTIEEAYEVADAIERRDMRDLKEELGDLLFQVVFHSQMAAEAGHFDVHSVADTIAEKMLRRHPHVFAAPDDRGADMQTQAWEDMKAAERSDKSTNGELASALDGIASALPALLRAEKIQKRAARVGFDWTEVGPIFDKLEEEIGEVKEAIDEGNQDHIEDEIGDLLFVCANLARRLNINPETALRKANSKFDRRFREMEALSSARGDAFSSLSLQEQEALWKLVKQNEN